MHIFLIFFVKLGVLKKFDFFDLKSKNFVFCQLICIFVLIIAWQLGVFVSGTNLHNKSGSKDCSKKLS